MSNRSSMYAASLIILLAIISFGGCRSPEVVRPIDVSIREVRDGLGRTVRVPGKIDRAISLAPSVTEMVFAAGAGDRLVGITTYCNYPAETANIEKIGDTQTPNIEKIIALKPQIVLVSTDSQLEAFTKTLDDQAIAVYVMDPKTLSEVLENLTQLGMLLGTSEAANKNVAELHKRLSEIENSIDLHEHFRMEIGGAKARVFVQISRDPLFTIGRDSFLTELIERAGGVCVTKDVATAYPKLSKESAAAFDAEIIFLSDSDDNREPSTALKDSDAVKKGRVYRINADIISRPGPRLLDALEQIATRIGRRDTHSS